jgi:hypothetical protein
MFSKGFSGTAAFVKLMLVRVLLVRQAFQRIQKATWLECGAESRATGSPAAQASVAPFDLVDVLTDFGAAGIK